MTRRQQREVIAWTAGIAVFVLGGLVTAYILTVWPLGPQIGHLQRAALMFLAVSAFCLPFAAYVVVRAALDRAALGDAASWPKIKGQIRSSEVKVITGEGEAYEPKISYVYVVGGQEFFGDTIQPGLVLFDDREPADALIAKYPAHAQVAIFYNPADPGESTLDPNWVGWSRSWSALAICILVPLACAILVYFFS